MIVQEVVLLLSDFSIDLSVCNFPRTSIRLGVSREKIITDHKLHGKITRDWALFRAAAAPNLL